LTQVLLLLAQGVQLLRMLLQPALQSLVLLPAADLGGTGQHHSMQQACQLLWMQAHQLLLPLLLYLRPCQAPSAAAAGLLRLCLLLRWAGQAMPA
jgi:hypothetical protein